MPEWGIRFRLLGKIKEHTDAARYANDPGFALISAHTIRMETDDYTDVLRCIPFVL